MRARVPALVVEAREIGFDEVIVEPEWLDGLDSACGLIEEAIAAVSGAGPGFRSAISSSDTLPPDPS
jgi:hypothetical protein